MICPSCSVENPDSARFCKNCGAPLAAPSVPAPPPPPPVNPPPPPVYQAPPPPPAPSDYDAPIPPPYEIPPAYQAPPPPAAGDARSKVQAPAIALMAVAILGIGWQVVWMILNLVGSGMSMLGNMSSDLPAEMAPEFLSLMSGGVGILFSLIGIGIGVVILLAALKMKKLQSWAFALIGSIIAMIPCLSPCCCIGLPVGIWALIVLLNKDVKSAFL